MWEMNSVKIICNICTRLESFMIGRSFLEDRGSYLIRGPYCYVKREKSETSYPARGDRTL